MAFLRKIIPSEKGCEVSLNLNRNRKKRAHLDRVERKHLHKLLVTLQVWLQITETGFAAYSFQVQPSWNRLTEFLFSYFFFSFVFFLGWSVPFVSYCWVTLLCECPATRLIWNTWGYADESGLCISAKAEIEKKKHQKSQNWFLKLLKRLPGLRQGLVPCFCCPTCPVWERSRPVSAGVGDLCSIMVGAGTNDKNLTTNSLQNPSTKGHGLQKATMNKISFFFYFSTWMRPHYSRCWVNNTNYHNLEERAYIWFSI